MTHLHIALLAGAGVILGGIAVYVILREFALAAMEIESGRRP